LRIGIPRTLWYFTYAPFWRTFFTGLGAEVVASRLTTRKTLDAGVTACVSEACLPIKLYFGHLIDLADRVDYLFVPRLMSVQGNRVFCPKFLGLPDLVRHSGLKLPPLLDVAIDRRTGPLFLWRSCWWLGRRLGARGRAIVRAFFSASRTQRKYWARLTGGGLPEGAKPPTRPDAHRAAGGAPPVGPPVRIALLGYPYLIFDEYANLGLLDKLRSLNVDYRTIETVPERVLRRQNPFFPKRPFWRYSDLVARSGYHFLGPGRAEVDGVVHVTAFACGPDALVDKVLELEGERKRCPYLNITLDEQSGEAGYITRLEAFVDMLRRRVATTPD
jgi:predicted nucleotide-binding protein (sugar kinase/HSP70/actin superfamily)